ncbi:uncharacterized protein [Littorina saxatilis]|uniref:uncharacterized protein n=1 Tax=Littorina saxatilis TaxID=31220 RepID=UPI0038B54D49
MEQADHMREGKVPACNKPPVSAPVLTVDHYGDNYRGDRQGHEGIYTWRCARCGELVGDMLNRLRIGCHDNAPQGQGGLTFNDVFVLGPMNCGTYITDDNDMSPAPFIRGLKSRGVPTRKVTHYDTAAFRQVDEMTSGATQRAAGRGRDEAVTVVNENTVWGSKRHVIVHLDCSDMFYHFSEPYGYLASQV